MGAWQTQPLGDALTFQRGFDITKDEQCEGPYSVISSSGPKTTHAEFKVHGPGVVIGRKGSLGTVFYSDANYWPHDTTLWVKDFHGNDPRFAYYFLQTMEFERLDAGASNPSLNRNHIHTISVRVPPLPTQRRIAGILSAYDELIENSQRRIRILEAMARALYREWIVHFRFPGHENHPRVASRLGEIPEGWEVKTLGDIAEEMRRNVRKGELEDPKPYVGLEHIPRRSLALDAWETATELGSNKLEFRRGEVLFGKIRPYFHKVSVAPFDGLCSADTIVIRARRSEYYAIVVACVSSDAFVAEASATANGAKMPRANWNVLKKYQVVIPKGKVADRFSALFADIITQQQALILQIQNLRRTRDLLLPRLLSGQVEVEAT
ncbi:MAG: restriction endonuclease subunit S [Ardenticatenia bacterium]|nr:restriction endonuclease subunit S [Ardenticatenia bacterium]